MNSIVTLVRHKKLGSTQKARLNTHALLLWEFYLHIYFILKNPSMNENETILMSKYISYHYELWHVIIFSVCDDHDVSSQK